MITYQDQVLEIARNFAGYTLGQADVMRKAMGKKIPAVMLAERERFVAGSIANGYEQRLAEQLFDLIEPFAGYAFNKAHAFSYAVIAYHTAYLKAHYPVEFMTAVLMAAGAHPTGAQERIAAAIAECTRLDIAVLPPDVNASEQNFQIGSRGDGSIRFGLAQIKNVGVGAVEGLLRARAEGDAFSSIEDFARRVDPRDCNRRVLESLAKAGAFDSLLRADRGEDRSAVVYGVDRILTVSQEAQRQRDTGQTSMFDLFGDEVDTPLPALELEAVRTPERESLGWERELLGTYVSAHPFREAAQRLAALVSHQTTELTAELSGQEAVVAGMVTSVRKLTTRQGKAFAAVTIEDLGGTAELTVWPDRYEQQRDLLVHGNVLLVKVDVRERGDRLTLAAEALAAYDQDAGRAARLRSGAVRAGARASPPRRRGPQRQRGRLRRRQRRGGRRTARAARGIRLGGHDGGRQRGQRGRLGRAGGGADRWSSAAADHDGRDDRRGGRPTARRADPAAARGARGRGVGRATGGGARRRAPAAAAAVGGGHRCAGAAAAAAAGRARARGAGGRGRRGGSGDGRRRSCLGARTARFDAARCRCASAPAVACDDGGVGGQRRGVLPVAVHGGDGRGRVRVGEGCGARSGLRRVDVEGGARGRGADVRLDGLRAAPARRARKNPGQ